MQFFCREGFLFETKIKGAGNAAVISAVAFFCYFYGVACKFKVNNAGITTVVKYCSFFGG